MEEQQVQFVDMGYATKRLAELMEENEGDMARLLKRRLFPEGVPRPFTVAGMMRAKAAMLARDAEAMAKADIAYNASRQKPGKQATSLLSQDVAEKLALSAELERLVLEHADYVGAEIEKRLFPAGAPVMLTLDDFLGALRTRIETVHSEVAETHESSEETASKLRDEAKAIVQIYSGFCTVVEKSSLCNEIRDLIGLPPEELYLDDEYDGDYEDDEYDEPYDSEDDEYGSEHDDT